MLATVISQSRRLTLIFNALGEYCDSSGEMPHFDQRNHQRNIYIYAYEGQGYRQGSVEYSLGFEFQKSVKFEFLNSVAAICILSVRQMLYIFGVKYFQHHSVGFSYIHQIL